jgi:3-hydroxyisobutyrate dehydrogenase-like beta-hydroxyacid dehydrogenase
MSSPRGAGQSNSAQAMPPVSIGFIGFGEVASRLSAALHKHGAKLAAYDVMLDQSGGSELLHARAGDAPVTFLPLEEVLARSTLVLSTVTTDVVLEAARSCVPHLGGNHNFVDLNATSPAIKRAIAATVSPSGACFVEGAILGAIGVTGAQTRILVCGEKAEGVADMLTRLGLNVGFYGVEIGRASTFKLLRSIFSKGMEALLLESMLAARRAGVGDDVWREIVATLDERPFTEVGGNWMRTHGTAHARRYHEMVQVEALVRELGIDPLVTNATTAFFERSARLGLAKSFRGNPADTEQVLAALDNLIGAAASNTKRAS